MLLEMALLRTTAVSGAAVSSVMLYMGSDKIANVILDLEPMLKHFSVRIFVVSSLYSDRWILS